MLLLVALGHVLADVVGRVHAEEILTRSWGWTGLLRRGMAPLTGFVRLIEAFAYRRSRQHAAPSRPASVEVVAYVRRK